MIIVEEMKTDIALVMNVIRGTVQILGTQKEMTEVIVEVKTGATAVVLTTIIVEEVAELHKIS